MRWFSTLVTDTSGTPDVELLKLALQTARLIARCSMRATGTCCVCNRYTNELASSVPDIQVPFCVDNKVYAGYKFMC